MVLQGEPLRAIEVIEEALPGWLAERQDILLQLLLLQFSLLVGRRDSTAALAFAKERLQPFASGKGTPDQVQRLGDCVSLLAYPDPEQAPLGDLVRGGHRVAVADSLNGALAAADGLGERTALEVLWRHLEVLKAESGERAGFSKPS